jgi:exosome complex component RRP41
VIEVDKFPRSEIRICVTVLCADGGMRAACVNAASLALAHAGVPMRELVAASGAALFAETLLADPTLREDAAGAALLVARGATRWIVFFFHLHFFFLKKKKKPS